MKQEKFKIKLLDLKMSIEQIIQITRLSEEKIKKIQ